MSEMFSLGILLLFRRFPILGIALEEEENPLAKPKVILYKFKGFGLGTWHDKTYWVEIYVASTKQERKLRLEMS